MPKEPCGHTNTGLKRYMVFAAAAMMAYVTGVNSPLAAGAAIAFVTALIAALGFLYFEYTCFAFFNVRHLLPRIYNSFRP